MSSGAYSREKKAKSQKHKMIKMNNLLLKKNQVSICRKNICINAYGENANMLAKAATVMLLFIGIASLIRANSNN